jgi:hypothetical protein
MICDTRLPGYTQSLMNPAKVVVHEVKSNGISQVIDLLRERISQASETAHLHTHRKILALNVGWWKYA